MSKIVNLRTDILILILSIILLLFFPNGVLSIIWFIYTIASLRNFLIHYFDFKIINNTSIGIIITTILKPVSTVILSKLSLSSIIPPSISIGILTLVTLIEGILIIRFSYLLKSLSDDLFGKLKFLRYIMYALGAIRPIIGSLIFFLPRLITIFEKDLVMDLLYIIGFIGSIILLSFLVILLIIYIKFIKIEDAKEN